MVLTRSMAASRASLTHVLPHDMVVEIAGHVAASSPQPMEDICSLRASCRVMRATCNERFVARRVALQREARMQWSDNERYLAIVGRLASAGNPEDCFLTGIALVFARRCTRQGVRLLNRLAAAGHRAAAYVLGVILYTNNETRDVAQQFIREVEGEAPAGAVDEKGYKAKRTNRECVRFHAQAVQAVRQVTWWAVKLEGPAPVMPPEDGRRCRATGCGEQQGWSDAALFCSERCRIRYECTRFFSQVPLPDA